MPGAFLGQKPEEWQSCSFPFLLQGDVDFFHWPIAMLDVRQSPALRRKMQEEHPQGEGELKKKKSSPVRCDLVGWVLSPKPKGRQSDS